MMKFISDCLLISTEVTLVMLLMLFITVIATVVAVKVAKGTKNSDPLQRELENLELKDVTEVYKAVKSHMQKTVLDEDELKKIEAEKKKEEKEERKARKKNKSSLEEPIKKNRIFVLSFNGDTEASQSDVLSSQISAVLSVAEPSDEVILKLTSPGGLVHEYGYAASQLSRIRQKGIKLTVCVDKVAASGGYMMACIGSRIISAQFAVIGSIGVVAEFPNFNRLLKKLNVDYEQETAGEYKRTLSMLGDNSDPKAREKFRQELEECHQLFKNHVSKYRPQIDINEIATGEHWFGVDAVKKHLVDDISTSDDYILTKIENSNNQVYEFVEKEPKKSLLKKLISGAYHGVIGSNKVM